MADLSKLLSDWTKAITSMDVTRGSEELLNIMAGLKVPGVNMDAVVAIQRENLEALSASNRAALAGMKAVGEWQVKILQETMQGLTTAISNLTKGGSPQEIAAAEAELARKAFETAVGEMRELAEIVGKANQQASEAIAKRIPASLNEIKDVLKLP
ncbi:MAG: TIGR01841 family phasin [Candidatus Accumulibacter phosphatis]|uniref:Phasin family protein n=1 Tax=Candidatus Accumulibacter cognatus TaxID=2954383 RepID=A0A080M465_9PROT|nr:MULTISPECIES: TIGR01841 family phasin [Candidatus Accumulibacter]MCC2866911.1 TIGR01841 family phasin [Candidatus Accumulibacter phosphatis]KFB76057.1 MAG: phasin family protein [Candidatus Accumulibacter cognatus]MBL8400936.1 TIGR01841 family phasin [Accumulibacter sp.]MBN8516817.1 TIGR01841 family phasin [Accumulibacter sp.]MBO3710700.1 TIGR01841 family phasin [Accumulibacter sp.]